MNEQALLSELRNSLQATIFFDEIIGDTPIRVTKMLITDETQRKLLTDKYVNLLNKINAETTL